MLEFFAGFDQLYLPVLLAVLGFIAKSLWDIYIQQRRRNIALLEKKLSEFYWPIAVRLQQIEVIWKKMFDDPHQPHHESGTLGEAIKKEIILKKHNEIVQIVENSIHIVEPNKEFRDIIGRYLEHVALYNALIHSGINDRFPAYYGAKFPKELVPLIEENTQELQDQLNRYLKRKSR